MYDWNDSISTYAPMHFNADAIPTHTHTLIASYTRCISVRRHRHIQIHAYFKKEGEYHHQPSPSCSCYRYFSKDRPYNSISIASVKRTTILCSQENFEQCSHLSFRFFSHSILNFFCIEFSPFG